jgi:hypothetical protein
MPLIFKGQHATQKHRMPWGVAASVAGAAVSSKMNKNKGGAGTSTASNEPWLVAQPWMNDNVVKGMALQQQYASNPFSRNQTAAYENQYGLSDYARTLVPSLLGQFQDQPLGFDPSNPSAKPKAFDWGDTGLLQGKSLLAANEPTTVNDADLQRHASDLFNAQAATRR